MKCPKNVSAVVRLETMRLIVFILCLADSINTLSSGWGYTV